MTSLCLRQVGALPAYASGEGSGVEVQKDLRDLARRGLASLSRNSQKRAAGMRVVREECNILVLDVQKRERCHVF